MPDFNVVAPPVSITNPKGSTSQELPRHMHKWGEPHIVVETEAEKDDALAKGYLLQPPSGPPKAEVVEEDEPVKPKAKKGDK